MMKKIILIILGLSAIVIGSFILNTIAKSQATYEGLPTVPCLDYTKPILEDFTFTIHMTVNGKSFPLDSRIGHDYGNCLHNIYTNDSSGKVFVSSNDVQDFTLGQFFDVWHKTFSKDQLLAYQKTNGYVISVKVNNNPVTTYRDTILHPNDTIEVVCQYTTF